MPGKLLLFLLLISLPVSAQKTSDLETHYKNGTRVLYQNQDSAYFYFEKVIKLADRKDNINYLMASYFYLLKANAIYFDLKNYRKNLKQVENLFQFDARLENFSKRAYYQNILVFYKGQYYYKMHEYDQAAHYFLQYKKQLQQTLNKPYTSTEYQAIYSAQAWLGNIYFNTHKFSLAKKYYQKNKDLVSNRNKGYDESAIALVNLSLANVFEKEKDYEYSKTLIQKSLDFYEEKTKQDISYRNNLISAQRMLAQNFLKQNLPDSALLVLKKMKISISHEKKNLKHTSSLLEYKAQALTQKEQFPEALKAYEKLLEMTKKYYNTTHHPEIAEKYAKMATILSKQGQFKKSISYFQKALVALSPGFEDDNLANNPSPEKVLSKLKLIDILRQKQKALALGYKIKNEVNYLILANQTAKDIVETLDALKPEFKSKIDRQFLLEETFPAFYQMMETAFQLYKKTGEKVYLEDAFHFSEKSKAVLLLTTIQNTGATKFFGIPDSIVIKEKQFQATINHLEKKKFKNPNQQNLSSELFDLKNSYYDFLSQVEKKYPKYHKLKYRTKVVNLATTQNLLSPQQAILDYYLTENYLYTFVITKAKVHLERMPFSKTYSKQILQLRELIAKPQVTKIKELRTLSNQVYQKIIPKLDSSISTLIILRSGILNYLPFGALYHTNKKGFLIEDYSISYAHSATLYKEFTNQKTDLNPAILAFAPSFSGGGIPKEDRTGLGELRYNKKEVKHISEYFNGTFFLNEQATLSAFDHNAKKFAILHFATHAIINDKFPDYSYLAFAPEKDSLSNLLYIKDLYNYDLNADLVVLSACETGIGKLQKGAGMLSLARGFNYAGASSLVTTQWKIDDESSSILMEVFYHNLAKGQAKNIALQNAKLDYLKTTDDVMLRHPYYWAGFVLTGNTSAVTEATTWKWWILAGLGLLVFALWGFAKNRKEEV